MISVISSRAQCSSRSGTKVSGPQECGTFGSDRCVPWLTLSQPRLQIWSSPCLRTARVCWRRRSDWRRKSAGCGAAPSCPPRAWLQPRSCMGPVHPSPRWRPWTPLPRGGQTQPWRPARCLSSECSILLFRMASQHWGWEGWAAPVVTAAHGPESWTRWIVYSTVSVNITGYLWEPIWACFMRCLGVPAASTGSQEGLLDWCRQGFQGWAHGLGEQGLPEAQVCSWGWGRGRWSGHLHIKSEMKVIQVEVERKSMVSPGLWAQGGGSHVRWGGCGLAVHSTRVSDHLIVHSKYVTVLFINMAKVSHFLLEKTSTCSLKKDSG